MFTNKNFFQKLPKSSKFNLFFWSSEIFSKNALNLKENLKFWNPISNLLVGWQIESYIDFSWYHFPKIKILKQVYNGPVNRSIKNTGWLTLIFSIFNTIFVNSKPPFRSFDWDQAKTKKSTIFFLRQKMFFLFDQWRKSLLKNESMSWMGSIDSKKNERIIFAIT